MKKFFANIICGMIPVAKYRRQMRTRLLNRAVSNNEPYIAELKKLGYRAKRTKDGINISGKGLNIFGRADNTFWTAISVLGGEYDFDSDGYDFIVIDIGLNIGCTSLWLAQKKFVKQIYSFEPFAPIFTLAENNMNKNPRLAKKIKIHNFGLSDRDDKIEISFNPKLPGSMSTITDRFSANCDVKETAELKDASKILKPILDAHNEKIMLKIDCEGGEREILPNLSESGLLSRASIIIMEWHDGIVSPLIDILKDNGFNVVIKDDNPQVGTGILFAKKIKTA